MGDREPRGAGSRRWASGTPSRTSGGRLYDEAAERLTGAAEKACRTCRSSVLAGAERNPPVSASSLFDAATLEVHGCGDARSTLRPATSTRRTCPSGSRRRSAASIRSVSTRSCARSILPPCAYAESTASRSSALAGEAGAAHGAHRRTGPSRGRGGEGRGFSETRTLPPELLTNEKERAEHIMLLDLEGTTSQGVRLRDRFPWTADGGRGLFPRDPYRVERGRANWRRGGTASTSSAPCSRRDHHGVPKVRVWRSSTSGACGRGLYTGSLGYLANPATWT